MTTDSLRTLRVTRSFDASPERVFDAWLNPETAGKWLFTTPTGKMVRVEIDARVGGSFNFTRRDGDDVEHIGTYLEIDRPRRLVFTFTVPKFSKQSTRVSIDIVPTPSGCELTLTHEGVLPEWADRVNEGWGKILGGLAANVDPNVAFGVVTEPGTIRFERVLPGPIEQVWAYLTESEKRGKWFAAGEIEPHVGGKFELRFDHASLSLENDPPPEKYKQMVEKPGPFYNERVTRYEPPRVLSWTWDGGIDGPSEVTFELKPQGEKVLFVLTHRRLAGKHMAGIAGGWHTHLAVLVEQINNRLRRPFWTIFAETDGEYIKRLGSK